MGCNCSDDIRARLDGWGRSRRIGWLDSLGDDDPRWYSFHAIFTRKKAEAPRMGRAIVVCACEPGSTRVGGTTVVIYGPPETILPEYLRSTELVVLVLLYTGTIPTELQERAGRDGRVLVVRHIEEPGGVLVMPLRGPSVRDLTP